MKAVAKFGYGDKEVEVRDVPEPQIGPGQVLVAMRAAGAPTPSEHAAAALAAPGGDGGREG